MASGGSGGYPNGKTGVAGKIGNGEGSVAGSGPGGRGASTPFGQGGDGGTIASTTDANGKDGVAYGAGGGGAGFIDRTDPLNWTGGKGASGGVAIAWGPGATVPAGNSGSLS